jgi:hypothetical protein
MPMAAPSLGRQLHDSDLHHESVVEYILLLGSH